jgi:hypothetical protein
VNSKVKDLNIVAMMSLSSSIAKFWPMQFLFPELKGMHISFKIEASMSVGSHLSGIKSSGSCIPCLKRLCRWKITVIIIISF